LAKLQQLFFSLFPLNKYDRKLQLHRISTFMHKADLSSSLKNDLPAAAKFIPPFLYLIYLVLVIGSRYNGFFWDSILLGSRYGQWYYDTNFSTLFVPESIAGYPPFFGMLLAFCWKLFGKTLAVSHLMILPFALGIVYQVLRLCRKFLPLAAAPFAALLVLADPTLMAQCTQVAPDVLLVFFYLLALNSILQSQRLLLTVALIFLGILSPRGTIAVPLLFLTEVILFLFFSKGNKTWPAFLKLLIPYFPAGILIVIWQALHYQHFGWIGYNPDSNWGAFTRFAGLGGMLRNLVIIIWRLLDFGRVFVWFGLLLSFGYFYRKRIPLPPATLKLLVLVLVPLVGYSLVFVPYTNPIGHRYYLVVFLLVALLTVYLLTHIPDRLFRRYGYGFMLLGLLCGNFWVYPDTVAKGWDASLAHLPYFNLREEAIAFLDEKKIPLEFVGSDYPNLAATSQTNLTNDNRSFKPKDLRTDSLVLYSNVFNGFSDVEISALKTDWQVIKAWKKGQVKIILYRKKKV
jgi:hypothetical protein